MSNTINRDTNTEVDEIYLKDVVLKFGRWRRFIFTKWKVILIAGITGGTIGILYAFLKKPIYKAELSFVLQDEKSGGGLSSAMGLASQFGIDLGGSGSTNEFSGDNLLQLMRSRTMVEQVLLTTVNVNGKNKTLGEFYMDFNDLHEEKDFYNIHFLPNADRSKFTLKEDSVLGVFYRDIIKDNLIVDKLDKKLSIISLKVNSKNELFSKFFTEILTKVVSDFYIKTKTEKEANNVTLLQSQTDSVRRALNYAITGVASSTDAAPNANPFMQTLRVPSQKKQVDVQANTAILSELVKNLEMAKMSLLHETPLIQVIDKPILPLEKDKVGKLKGLFVGMLSGMSLMIFLLSLNKLYRKVVE